MGKRQLFEPYKPCPCGSGEKYKFCCYEAGRELPGVRGVAGARPVSAPELRAQESHRLDGDLVGRLLRYGKSRFPGAGLPHDEFEEAMGGNPEDAQIFAPWAAYHRRMEGRALLDWFLEEREHELAASERVWLEAQSRAWISIWEATEVVPAESLALLDLLSGEARQVIEKSGSRTLRKGAAILGRVVDYEGVSLLAGIHSNPLPPDRVRGLTRAIRSELAVEGGNVPIEILRREETMAIVVSLWEVEVENLRRSLSVPPRLTNTNGDELLPTTDTFTIPAGRAPDATARLLALPGATRDTSEEEATIVFVKPGNRMNPMADSTVVGRATIVGETLRLETNSLKRADDLRRRVEEACPGLAHHGKREHQDTNSMWKASRARGPRVTEPPSADALAAMRAFKERHYAAWLDESIPALRGMTPREAAKSPVGREMLLQLLKEMEYSEAGLPERERYDFSRTRRRLGLEP